MKKNLRLFILSSWLCSFFMFKMIDSLRLALDFVFVKKLISKCLSLISAVELMMSTNLALAEYTTLQRFCFGAETNFF